MALPRAVQSAMHWPPFLFSIGCMWWSVAILCVNYHVKWLNFTKKRNDVLSWSSGMKAIHKFTVLKVGSQDLFREPCMYLCNHRSWADFMVDQYVTEGRSLFMSRWAVVLVFPLFMIPIRAIRAVILFKRGHIADKDGFNRWIDQQIAASPQPALAVYPEGHRSTDGESLPLKRGMLKYAYTRKMPVQIVIGANKEAILSEKHRTARFRQTVAVGFSEVIRPGEYEDFELFMDKVQATWDAEWNEVFSAEWEGLPVLPEAKPEHYLFEYPFDIRFYMFTIAVFNLVAAAWVLWKVFALIQWGVAAAGPVVGYGVLTAVVAFLVASFHEYSKPVNALEVHQRMMRQVKRQPHQLGSPLPSPRAASFFSSDSRKFE